MCGHPPIGAAQVRLGGEGEEDSPGDDREGGARCVRPPLRLQPLHGLSGGTQRFKCSFFQATRRGWWRWWWVAAVAEGGGNGGVVVVAGSSGGLGTGGGVGVVMAMAVVVAAAVRYLMVSR